MQETKDIVLSEGRANSSLLGMKYKGFQNFWASNQTTRIKH